MGEEHRRGLLLVAFGVVVADVDAAEWPFQEVATQGKACRLDLIGLSRVLQSSVTAPAGRIAEQHCGWIGEIGAADIKGRETGANRQTEAECGEPGQACIKHERARGRERMWQNVK